MNARVMKDLRQLAWPWAFVTCGAVLSLFHLPWLGYWSHVLQLIIVAGAFLGIPLLATLPIGAEFQHRTFALNLAQPISRDAVWRLKMAVTAGAVLVPAALYSRSVLWGGGRSFWMGVAVITAFTAGTTFWTLVARSIIGGLGLSACAVGAGEVIWMYLADSFGLLESRGPLPAPWVWGMAAAAFGYSAIIIWLGRRKMLTFQAVEGMQAGETVIPGARFVPAFVVDWFRPRPTGAVLNLVRREFHLLRVVWALALLVFLDWGFIVAFRLADERGGSTPIRALQFITIVGAVAFSGLIAILAGVLSLGEEKNWGTHEWHMTVPISTPAQWTVKLLVALFTSVVGAALAPLSLMILRGWLHGSPFLHASREILIVGPAEAALVTLGAFWCASLVKGTMRATLWAFSSFFILGLAAGFGYWVFTLMGERATGALRDVIWRFDPVAAAGVAAQVINLQNILPLGALLLAPGVAIAIVQSYRFFRAQAEDTNLHVLRSITPLAITAALCGFAVSGSEAFVRQAWEEQEALVRDMHRAIEAIQPAATGSARPQQLTADELAKASPMSDRTRQWLAGSSIAVAPTFPELHVPLPGTPSSRFPMTFSFSAAAASNKDDVPYAAVIHRASGMTCYITFSTSRFAHFGFAGGQCE